MRFDFPFLWCSWCCYFCFCPPPVSAFPPILYPANLLDPESDSNIRMIIAHLPGWTRAHAEAAALSRRCGCWSPRLLGGFSSELVSPHNALDVLPLRCVSLFVFWAWLSLSLSRCISESRFSLVCCFSCLCGSVCRGGLFIFVC